MIVTPIPYGRMGNRLLLATHFLAHAEEHGGSYWHLAFWPYNRYFEGTRGKTFLHYVPSKGPRVEGAAKRRWPVSFWFELFGLDWRPGPGHPVSDMHSMSLCDAIIGPPSTFSGWDSFMGRVPRLQIKSRNQAVRREDFASHAPEPGQDPKL